MRGVSIARGAKSALNSVIVVALVAACGSQASAPGAPKATPAAEVVKSRVWTDRLTPPPFTLHFGNQKLDIQPYSFCYGKSCADGIPRKPLASVGSPKSIVLELGLTDWTIEANFRTSGTHCGRSQSITLKPGKDGLYRLPPLGHVGTYDVELFGHGEGGDVAGSFRWKTPTEGPFTAPSAVMALVSDNDGRPDSYGLELGLSNIATSPKSVSATIQVTAANGRSLNLVPRLAGYSCAANGNVSFVLAREQAQAAAAIGGFPFRYDVTVVLDGATYHATANYPDDEIKGNEPNVALTFSPALPTLK